MSSTRDLSGASGHVEILGVHAIVAHQPVHLMHITPTARPELLDVTERLTGSRLL